MQRGRFSLPTHQSTNDESDPNKDEPDHTEDESNNNEDESDLNSLRSTDFHPSAFRLAFTVVIHVSRGCAGRVLCEIVEWKVRRML